MSYNFKLIWFLNRLGLNQTKRRAIISYLDFFTTEMEKMAEKKLIKDKNDGVLAEL